MIFLDYQADEPKIFIKLIEESKLPPWVKKTLIGKIQTDIDEKEKRKNCKHNIYKYIGQKDMCGKCFASDGELWELEHLSSYKKSKR